MTLGWIFLLDPNYGLINKLAVDWLGFPTAPSISIPMAALFGFIWRLAPACASSFYARLQALDATLEEAAQVAGSSAITTLTRITVPVLLPAVLATTMLSFIKSLESMEIEIVLASLPVFRLLHSGVGLHALSASGLPRLDGPEQPFSHCRLWRHLDATNYSRYA